MKYLIVNADDFGLGSGVNAGIIESYEKGIVTSASIMVRRSAAEEAGAYARRNPDLSLGLHVDLGEWRNVGGNWELRYEVVPFDDEVAIRSEVNRQLEVFQTLAGRMPSHLDSHQNVHLREPVRSVLREVAESLDVPLRRETKRIRYCGSFYGRWRDGRSDLDAISPDGLLKILRGLEDPVTELACHPGLEVTSEALYGHERETEVRTLCDPRIRQALETLSIRLCSFTSVPG